MANAFTMRIRSKTYLPGSGFDGNGAPVQGKQHVTGRIVGTGYDNTTGLIVAPTAFGLRTLDTWKFRVVKYNNTTTFGGAATNTQPTVLFNPTASAIWINVQPGAATQITTNTNFEVAFEVSGDTAEAPELR